jgi:arabinan endo-1,5-alpha-L-arabinosidase
MVRIFAITLALLTVALTACGSGGTSIHSSLAKEQAGTYRNLLRITVPGGTLMESCPDPSVIRGQQPGDNNFYLYCTAERFTDRAALHWMATSKSQDLVNWTYVGDVFSSKPSFVASDGYLWAPDIEFFNGKYYLYYSVSDTQAGGAAIFVATSDTPTGPWDASSTPVVEPEPVPGRGMRSTIDPAIVTDGDQRYIFYGSFNGGISARALSSDGLTSNRASQVQIALPDRYEAAYVIKRNDYFYLFVSAGACCEGPLSGYGVFVARSPNALGPYIDKDGNSLLESRIGGTPVVGMNGNRWIGPGHNAVITDSAGTDWMIYHAIDAGKPYFAGSWTRRPAMIDRLDWVDDWPVVRNGAGPSDSEQTAPITGMTTSPTATAPSLPIPIDSPGPIITSLSDDFDGNSLSPQWEWIRQPSPSTFAVADGVLRFDSEAGDIFAGQHSASLLTEPAPVGDFMVEVKLSNNVPIDGQLNFVQGGVLIYKDDSNYVKLVTVAINGTRQIEFAKQYPLAGNPRYGSTFLASPADTTYLRIVRHTISGTSQELYTAYSSHDGVNWERGGTWTHSLGTGARIGLVSMGRAGFSNYFDYVRVYDLLN